MMRPKRNATDGTCISELEKKNGTESCLGPLPHISPSAWVEPRAPRTSGPARNLRSASLRSPFPVALRLGCIQLPEVPEEEVADLAVRQGSVQQEFGQLAVQVGLVFEHLHKLQKVLEKLIIPAEKQG